jgi:hypothetical protein
VPIFVDRGAPLDARARCSGVWCSFLRCRSHRLNIRRDELEPRILNTLQHRLMDPALFKDFCDEFTREMNRLRMEGRAAIEGWREELGKVERQIRGVIDAIKAGMFEPSMKAEMAWAKDHGFWRIK